MRSRHMMIIIWGDSMKKVKPFKINKLEKFIIRHSKLLRILSFAFLIGGPSFTVNGRTVYEGAPIICFLLFFVFYMFFAAFPAAKADRIVYNRNYGLDLYKASEDTIKLMECISPKDILTLPVLCNNRIAYLIDVGETEKAEEEIRLFWQTFDLKKLQKSTLACIHINMAEIKLRARDAKGYDEQLRIIYTYQRQCKKAEELALKKSNALPRLLLSAEAVFGSFTNDFESRVFSVLNTVDGKQRKKQPSPIEYFSAYETLFTYFKRFEIHDKAKYYAEMTVQTGNGQFAAYREAKQYLEQHV